MSQEIINIRRIMGNPEKAETGIPYFDPEKDISDAAWKEIYGSCQGKYSQPAKDTAYSIWLMRPEDGTFVDFLNKTEIEKDVRKLEVDFLAGDKSSLSTILKQICNLKIANSGKLPLMTITPQQLDEAITELYFTHEASYIFLMLANLKIIYPEFDCTPPHTIIEHFCSEIKEHMISGVSDVVKQASITYHLKRLRIVVPHFKMSLLITPAFWEKCKRALKTSLHEGRIGMYTNLAANMSIISAPAILVDDKGIHRLPVIGTSATVPPLPPINELQ